MKERRAINQLESGLIVLVLILAGVAGYAFTIGAPASKTVTNTVGGTSTVTTTVNGGGTASPLSKLKVALILPIDPSDNSWNYQADYAVKQLKSAYGFTLNETFDKATGTDAQPVAVNYAQQGFNVIFLQGIQYQTMASTLAPQFPNVLFVCVDCLARNYTNVFLIWLDIGGAGFIEGAMAGMLSQSHIYGLVGGGRVPSIWAGHEGFKAGVLYTDPKAKTPFQETYEAFAWSDVSGATKTANQEIANGADVVFSSGDGIDVGVLGAARAASTQVWATNAYTNLSSISAASANNKILLASIVVDWTIPYAAALRAYVGGTWRNGFLTASIASGMVSVQPGPSVPANVKALANKLQTLFFLQSLALSFKTDATSGSFTCFEQSTPTGQCTDTSTGNTAAILNYLPPLT
jgi:basic membrane lipoprotein Med (substrate-binding protein (PBP1-ABC) superfamily)